MNRRAYIIRLLKYIPETKRSETSAKANPPSANRSDRKVMFSLQSVDEWIDNQCNKKRSQPECSCAESRIK